MNDFDVYIKQFINREKEISLRTFNDYMRKCDKIKNEINYINGINKENKEIENTNIELNNLTEYERNQLFNLIAKAVNIDKYPFKLGEFYYFIDAENIIQYSQWFKTEPDKKRFKMRNVFKTKAEADFECNCREVEAELKNFADKHNSIRFHGYKSMWYYIFYNSANKVVDICGSLICPSNREVCFSSYEIAQQAIAEIKAERLKKYYFKMK